MKLIRFQAGQEVLYGELKDTEITVIEGDIYREFKRSAG